MADSKPAAEIPPYKNPSLTFSQRKRISVDMIAADPKEAPTLCDTIRSSIDAVIGSYTNSQIPLANYEAHVHDLWYTFVAAAKVTPADDPAMDRIVLLVLAARERGPVSRILWRDNEGQEQQQQQQKGEATTTVEHAIFPTASGKTARLFIDLPFLVPDLLDVWRTILSPSSTVSVQQRCNLASFTARLVSLHACRDDTDRLALPALWLLRAVAETKRNDVDADMLRAVLEWNRHGGYTLLGLAVKGVGEDDAEGELGELARGAGVGRGGWSLERWNFWKQRFGEMKEAFEGAGDEEGAALARRCASSLRLKEEGVGAKSKGPMEPLRVFYQVA